MNGRTQVEVVMEYNVVARARVDHPVWAPAATSTPIRKPLFTLNNAGDINSRQCDVKPPNATCKALETVSGEGKRALENINKNIVKKRNKTSRSLHYLDDDDDSSDEMKDNQPKKHLIIKLGSTQFNKRSIRKKTFGTETSSNSNEQEKDGSVDDFFKPTKSGDTETDEINGNESEITLQKAQDLQKHVKDAILEKTSRNLNKSESNYNKTVNCENCITGVKNNNKSSNNGINDEVNGNKPQKRKNKALKTICPKKLKTESNRPILSQCVGNMKKAGMISHKIKSEKIESAIVGMRHESISKLSMSHEIFSDSKEREFRDSLDLTADDDLELDTNDLNGFKVLTKKVDLSKHKNKSQSNKNIHSDNLQFSRPRREKNSPREFWLPKPKKDDVPLQDNNSLEKQVKDDDCVVSSTVKSNEPEDVAIAVSASGTSGRCDHISETAYVKTISEMEFEENSSQDEKKKFSVALGWQFPTFRCCALKIGAKCEASGRTKSKKNHLGGVLLKGRLSMKIGESEVKMKDGQMFYVPPLTDWKAVNIGRIDCVLYYWAGVL